jgi:hypothetical protein
MWTDTSQRKRTRSHPTLLRTYIEDDKSCSFEINPEIFFDVAVLIAYRVSAGASSLIDAGVPK